MKRILLTIALVLCMVAPALGDTVEVSLAWNANTESDLDGYKLYINDVPTDVGNVTAYTALINVLDGENYIIKFELTAYDTSDNESEKSTPPLILTADSTPPAPPTGLIGTVVEIIIAALKWIANFLA